MCASGNEYCIVFVGSSLAGWQEPLPSYDLGRLTTNAVVAFGGELQVGDLVDCAPPAARYQLSTLAYLVTALSVLFNGRASTDSLPPQIGIFVSGCWLYLM